MDTSYIHLLQNTFEIPAAGLKDWGGLHPLVVHFPIALLFMAPVLILLGWIGKSMRSGFFASAFLLMVCGAAFIHWSISTGNAAAENLQPSPVYAATLDAHVQLAEQSRLSFLLLAGGFLVCMALTRQPAKRKRGGKRNAVLALYLLIYISQLVVLFGAAHQGARLVHEHGLSSTMFSGSHPAPVSSVPPPPLPPDAKKPEPPVMGSGS